MPYRLEYAKTGRGGCSMAKCKHALAKVPQGAIKMGQWVDGAEDGKPFFTWRHWGCVTPKFIQAVLEDLNGDYANLDGYEDLTEADQERIAEALAAGSVPEEDQTVFTEEEQQHYDNYIADEERLKELKQEFKETGKEFKLKEQRQILLAQRLAAVKEVSDQRKEEAKLQRQKERADAKAANQAAKEEEREQKKQAKAEEKEANKASKAAANTGRKRKAIKDEEDSDEPVKKEEDLKDGIKEEIKDEDDGEVDEAEEPPQKKQRGGRRPKTQADQDKPATGARKPTRAKKQVKAEPDSENEEASADDEEPEPELEPKPKAKRGRKAAKVESDAEEPVAPKPRAKRAKKVVKRAYSAELTNED